HCFAIYYSKEGVRQYDLRADTEEECRLWVDAINNASPKLSYCFAPNSFGKMLEQKQEAEQKQLHLLQILETERRAKWHYVKQIEDLTAEVKKLKSEILETERRAKWHYVKQIEDLTAEVKKLKSEVSSGLPQWLVYDSFADNMTTCHGELEMTQLLTRISIDQKVIVLT
ncbi:hypothetical protein T265_15358, partial [Opisthorchis viverrini]